MGKIPFTCPPLVGQSVRSLPLGMHQTVPLLMRALRVGRHSPPPQMLIPWVWDWIRGESAYFMSPSVTRSSQLVFELGSTTQWDPTLCLPRAGAQSTCLQLPPQRTAEGSMSEWHSPQFGHRAATVASLFCFLLKTVASVTGGQTVQEVPDWNLRNLCGSAR